MGKTATEAKLRRKTFVTSRSMDFLSRKELTAQTGHNIADWPLAILKELGDNALDACEEAETVPEIDVRVDKQGIYVTDNGPGIPADVVESILDFSTRTSSREAYVAPDRGAQGNAFKTLIAMPFALDGEVGRVTVAGHGVRHEITLRKDAIHQKPVIQHTPEPDPSATVGTEVFVTWPNSGRADEEFRPSEVYSSCSIMQYAKPQFLQMARNFAIFNPHLSLTLDWHGERHAYLATDPAWPKWRPSDPTSPHWYNIEDFARLVAAYIAADQQEGRDRTVREFIAEFRGLAGTRKQKAVLDATGLARKSLSSLVSNGELDRPLLMQLLAAMQANSKPVKPPQLGMLGKDHVERQLQSLGCGDGTIRYLCKMGESDGTPWILECAFGSDERLEERQLVAGVNWSPSIGNPFRQLGDAGVSLDSVLQSQRAGEDEPVVVLVHLATARAAFADRGKSTLVIGE